MLDIYWKNEHRLMCSGEICTAAERDRYEKSVINFRVLSLSKTFGKLTVEVIVNLKQKINKNKNYKKKMKEKNC